MKKLLRTLGWILFAGLMLATSAIVYSTARGYMTWYFRVNGSVTVNGEKAGYLHANTQRTVLLITRTDGSRPETYLVPIASSKSILDCGHWRPVRFLPIAIGDLNPPCWFSDPKAVMDAPVASTLVSSRRSVAFSTVSGKKVKAEW